MQFDDRAEDEPYKKFVVEVYNVVMDGVINSFRKQFFVKFTNIYGFILSPSNFNDIKNGLTAKAFCSRRKN